MIACVQTMHKYGFVHRDIKCENFIFSKDNSMYTLLILDKRQITICNRRKCIAGTPLIVTRVEEDGWMSDESDVYRLE